MRVPYPSLMLGLLLTAHAAFAQMAIEPLDLDGIDVVETPPTIHVPGPDTGGEEYVRKTEKGPLDEALRFRNGDTLHGNLLEITPEQMLTWVRPDIQQPIQMQLENLRGIKLFKKPDREPAGTRVELTNGDILYGVLTSLTEEELLLETTFAGALEIPRVMVASLQPETDSDGATLLAGPIRLSEWGHKQGDWEQKGNQMSSHNGQLGRDLNLPDKIHVKLDVSWVGAMPSFSIITHTPDIRRFYNDCYNLQVQSTHLNLNQGSGRQNFGNHQYAQLRQMRKMRMDLFVDKEEKRVVVFIDGELVKQWTNLNYAPTGTGFMLISYGNYGPTSFANLKIMRWNGKLPNLERSGAVEKEDFVHFSNGDKMSGSVMSIADDKLLLKPDFSDAIPIPIERIEMVYFASENSERARRNSGDAKLFYPDSTHVTVKLAEIKNAKFIGESEHFGKKEFDLDAFIGILFNIYDDEADESIDDFQEFMLRE